MEYRILNFEETVSLNYENCFVISCNNIEDGYVVLDRDKNIVFIISKSKDIESELIDKVLLYLSI